MWMTRPRLIVLDRRGPGMSVPGTNLPLCSVVLVWGSLLSSTDFNNSIFLPFFLILLILLFDLPAEPILSSRPAASWARRAQGRSRMAVAKVVHLRAAISRPLLDGPRARRHARVRRDLTWAGAFAQQTCTTNITRHEAEPASSGRQSLPHTYMRRTKRGSTP